mmetsp:Transcript_63229/g.137506  ORF Transcript_63229/g.137506 Transcript_63229/m.137506 type:complete len:203 (-) Transcript_63229:252-860(-)
MHKGRDAIDKPHHLLFQTLGAVGEITDVAEHVDALDTFARYDGIDIARVDVRHNRLDNARPGVAEPHLEHARELDDRGADELRFKGECLVFDVERVEGGGADGVDQLMHVLERFNHKQVGVFGDGGRCSGENESDEENGHDVKQCRVTSILQSLKHECCVCVSVFPAQPFHRRRSEVAVSKLVPNNVHTRYTEVTYTAIVRV